MTDICQYDAKPDHLHWEPLLHEWMFMMQKYHKVTEDAPYWYTERANVGLLAAAAWRCGYVALEEYGDTKRRAKADAQSAAADTRDYSGRIDLWIGRHGCPEGEIIEAKLAWLTALHDIPKTKKELQRGMENAIAAAKESKSGKGATLALTFYVPAVAPGTGDIVAQINKLVELAKEQKSSVIAWYFPESSRQMYLEEYQTYYPGVLLIGCQVLRGH